MELLKQFVTEIYEEDAAPFCLSIKLGSRDDIEAEGPSQGKHKSIVRIFRSGVAVALQWTVQRLV